MSDANNNTMNAIWITETGTADVLKLQSVPKPTPRSGQVLVRIRACGVNFIDVYFREGRYKADVPFVPGQEASGTVEAVGEGVTGFAVGDAVAWCSVLGTYAEYAAVPAEKLIHVPKGISFEQAASAMLQGMTAHYLATSAFPLSPGQTALIHAGAGGVGLLLIQMAKMRGARVITTVSTAEKAALAKDAGADEVINYTTQDFLVETRRITGNEGVNVVYDSVGKTTFDKSLECLKTRGMLVLFGGSSGAVPPFDLIKLSTMGSLFVTRPNLGNYTRTREELELRAGDVLQWIQEGKLKLRIEHKYKLAEAKQAHLDLEARKTTGKLLLIP